MGVGGLRRVPDTDATFLVFSVFFFCVEKNENSTALLDPPPYPDQYLPFYFTMAQFCASMH